jgi:hypothetical protein
VCTKAAALVLGGERGTFEVLAVALRQAIANATTLYIIICTSPLPGELKEKERIHQSLFSFCCVLVVMRHPSRR